MVTYYRLNKQKERQCREEGIDHTHASRFREMGDDSPLFRCVYSTFINTKLINTKIHYIGIDVRTNDCTVNLYDRWMRPSYRRHTHLVVYAMIMKTVFLGISDGLISGLILVAITVV